MHVGMEGRVGVPCCEEAGAVGVDECDCGGEGWVVIDDVAEVGHRFFAFVQRSGQLRCGEVCSDATGVQRIDDVNGTLPVWQVICDPRHVVCD